MNISCLDFLQKKNLEENLFVIYGKEPACIFKSKEHIIENSFLDSDPPGRTTRKGWHRWIWFHRKISELGHP